MREITGNDLFFACSLIEQIGRMLREKRSTVVADLGKEVVDHLLDYADVFHCEPIAKVAEEFIEEYDLKPGAFDNVAAARYRVPDVFTFGKVCSRLVEDVAEEGESFGDALRRVYTSWIIDHLSDYNSDFYYQPRDYLAACYAAGTVLDDDSD